MKLLVFSLFFGSAMACEKKSFHFSAKDANGAAYSHESFSEPVKVYWYEGKNTKEVNRELKNVLNADEDLQKGKFRPHYRSIGIANYEETSVPNFIIRSIIKSEIEKTNSIILDDLDQCFSSEGDSEDCVLGKRLPVFVHMKPNIMVTIDNLIVKSFVDRVDAKSFHEYIRKLIEQKVLQKDFCELRAMSL